MIDNELKTIIKEYIYSEIDSSNEINGFSSNLSCMKSMRDKYDMKKTLSNEHIKITDDSVIMNGETIAEIQRTYSVRRVNLCYKQLKPKIIWFD